MRLRPEALLKCEPQVDRAIIQNEPAVGYLYAAKAEIRTDQVDRLAVVGEQFYLNVQQRRRAWGPEQLVQPLSVLGSWKRDVKLTVAFV